MFSITLQADMLPNHIEDRLRLVEDRQAIGALKGLYVERADLKCASSCRVAPPRSS